MCAHMPPHLPRWESLQGEEGVQLGVGRDPEGVEQSGPAVPVAVPSPTPPGASSTRKTTSPKSHTGPGCLPTLPSRGAWSRASLTCTGGDGASGTLVSAPSCSKSSPGRSHLSPVAPPEARCQGWGLPTPCLCTSLLPLIMAWLHVRPRLVGWAASHMVPRHCQSSGKAQRQGAGRAQPAASAALVLCTDQG